MNNTVAVTGGTGFIGKHILANLLSRGFTVRALTRTPRSDSDQHITWVHGSLEDRNSLAELVKGARYIVHGAGQVRGHTEEVFTRCNVMGSLRLLQAAKEGGCCERFLFISSLAARHPELSWYANSKYIAEQKLAAMSSGISLGIFRPTAVYGPGDQELKPLFDWMLRGILPQLSTAETKLSFIHVIDLALAVTQWLSCEAPQARIYELCDGTESYSWKQLQEIATEARNGPVRLVSVPLYLLQLIADISTRLSQLAGKEPMLTREKIGELTHADWSVNINNAVDDFNWSPGISLTHAFHHRLF
ncbi:NAD-dependent epimerase/dehydratase family protein [Pseudocitrobacter cyperus]|uniref:NAD-dependent epimerase/dehydratase family protein n=1 Tax=Pseudocitrobacter cyperus TaxID=3112843 RepID=A0ABV0HNP5_9ENTR